MSDVVPALEVEGLTRYYGDLLAVDHVSFEVRQGEVFGFLGPNGAGKTTTIRMLTTRLEPTEGTAHIRGKWCFEVIDLSKEGYVYNPAADLFPTRCE